MTRGADPVDLDAFLMAYAKDPTASVVEFNLRRIVAELRERRAARAVVVDSVTHFVESLAEAKLDQHPDGGSCRMRHPKGSEAGTCPCVAPAACPLPYAAKS